MTIKVIIFLAFADYPSAMKRRGRRFVAICHITLPYNADDQNTIFPKLSFIILTILYAVYVAEVVG